MALHRIMPSETREMLAPGSIWTIDGDVYRIEKIVAVRGGRFWEDGVNYVPLALKPGAPNDYVRAWQDFLNRAEPVVPD